MPAPESLFDKVIRQMRETPPVPALTKLLGGVWRRLRPPPDDPDSLPEATEQREQSAGDGPAATQRAEPQPELPVGPESDAPLTVDSPAITSESPLQPDPPNAATESPERLDRIDAATEPQDRPDQVDAATEPQDRPDRVDAATESPQELAGQLPDAEEATTPEPARVDTEPAATAEPPAPEKLDAPEKPDIPAQPDLPDGVAMPDPEPQPGDFVGQIPEGFTAIDPSVETEDPVSAPEVAADKIPDSTAQEPESEPGSVSTPGVEPAPTAPDVQEQAGLNEQRQTVGEQYDAFLQRVLGTEEEAAPEEGDQSQIPEGEQTEPEQDVRQDEPAGGVEIPEAHEQPPEQPAGQDDNVFLDDEGNVLPEPEVRRRMGEARLEERQGEQAEALAASERRRGVGNEDARQQQDQPQEAHAGGLELPASQEQQAGAGGSGVADAIADLLEESRKHNELLQEIVDHLQNSQGASL